jgi:uncharacterized Zn finger protein
MSKKKSKPKDPFIALSWDDLNDWAGSRIVNRGRSYQRQGLVSGLGKTRDGGLIAWVDGTHRYATKVFMEDGLPSSICSCPHEYECKHGVATILEYLEKVNNNKAIPNVCDNDERLNLLADGGWDDDWDEEDDESDESTNPMEPELRSFLESKTKKDLIERILTIAAQHPEIGQDLVDCKHVTSGNTKTTVTRLKNEIQRFTGEPDWQYGDESSDFLQMAGKLDLLLKAGHADDVLALGKELFEAAERQIEMGFEEADIDLEDCIPILVKALERSSMSLEDRLVWVIDILLNDEYSQFEDLGVYLDQKHTKSTWSALVDQLWARLKAIKTTSNNNDFHRDYQRDCFTDWIVYALERAGRKQEIIPLCEDEAPKTQSYVRLVERLMAAKRYPEAQAWIQRGIDATQDKYAGIASSLREAQRRIHSKQKDFKTLAVLQVQEFVWHPSPQAFTECKKAATKVKLWNKMRPILLTFLEKGTLPWKQKSWPFDITVLTAPQPNRYDSFPRFTELIEIAILEKKPDQVLHWYDRRPRKSFWGIGIDEDAIATAIQTHDPDRAVAIWQKMAENLIAQMKPRAYEEAAQYLRKAGAVMAKKKKKGQWTQYLHTLRQIHARKPRFLAILDGLDGKPIINTD